VLPSCGTGFDMRSDTVPWKIYHSEGKFESECLLKKKISRSSNNGFVNQLFTSRYSDLSSLYYFKLTFRILNDNRIILVYSCHILHNYVQTATSTWLFMRKGHICYWQADDCTGGAYFISSLYFISFWALWSIDNASMPNIFLPGLAGFSWHPFLLSSTSIMT